MTQLQQPVWSQVERLHAQRAGRHTNQHMALTYMNGCQQGQMCWESLKSRGTFIKVAGKAANICWAVENNSCPIWQFIRYWPHNYHHFSWTFRITYLSPFTSMMINAKMTEPLTEKLCHPLKHLSIFKKVALNCLFSHSRGKANFRWFGWSGEILKLPLH